MNKNNPAALQGWIKAVDPKSGRTYFANTVSRKTQWEAPQGWIDEIPPPFMPSEDDEEDEELPSNWEVMHDPSSGKPFYVDHERKITQWTRPRAEKKKDMPLSYAPANTTTTSAAMARILQASSTRHQMPTRSYSQEASYFQHAQLGETGDVDFSDSMPTLEFSVKKVADKHRLECPHCNSLFTLSKRRHHCRLCGDVFCDACSSHRVSLPMEGQEFEKPVRICDLCNKDVEQGNFFSMRRYLTPLTLYEPDGDEDDEENGVATSANVNAALASLTSDLDQMMHNAEGFEEKVTIPSSILIPTITKHLNAKSATSQRAVIALASLLSLGSMAGKADFAHAIYLYGKRQTLDQILSILERSGSDRKTLFVQEKAAQAMFYLTDSQILSSIAQKHHEHNSTEDLADLGNFDSLDLQRCLRNMLDHSSNRKNPNLQRWATATVRSLVIEDQRRACLAINEVAARVSSGEQAFSLEYESFLDQLVSTGGVMILCSLIGADDSDTRAHATGALEATLSATRAIDGAMTALHEMTSGLAGRNTKKDGEIVRAITAGGGFGSSVSQLLLSADNTVAGMGCDFVAALVRPLLAEPDGTATLPAKYDWRSDPDGLGACREAALEIACGGCLPALLSLVQENGRLTRPINLRATAMETFAATAFTVGEIGKAWSSGKYEEGLSTNEAPASLMRAITALNEEQVIDIALSVLKSSSVQSLGSQRDTPAVRIREAAGMVLGAITSCSADAIMELHSRQVLSDLILAANDPSMTAPSNLRGDTAPRCLGMLEAAASILMFTWQHPSGASSELLDRLIEAIDVGAITYLFRVLTFKMDWDSRDKSAGGMKARVAGCRLVCCLFGIALTDETSIGMRRLMDACDADQSGRKTTRGPRNVMEAVLTALQTSLTHAHKMLAGGMNRGIHFQTALLDLVEASLLATGSMCGSSVAPGGGEGVMIRADQFLAMRADEFESRRTEVCKVACEVVIRGRTGPALLPTMLVGGFGEGAVSASLRLALAIAQNGTKEQHSKLARSGILVPVSDLLKIALSAGDLYRFSASLALVRFCGPYVATGTSGGVQSVRDAIRVATNVLTLPIDPAASALEIQTQESLKAECISALESLSKNAALWSAISTDALPSIVRYLETSFELGMSSLSHSDTRSAALRAVLEIVQVPSHAVAAAEAGLAKSLGRVLAPHLSKDKVVDDGSTMLALEVLHLLASNPSARDQCNLVGDGILRSVCAAIANELNAFPIKNNFEGDKNVLKLGFEIIHVALADIECIGETPSVLQSTEAVSFLDAIVSEPRFIHALCATLLQKRTDMQLKSHDQEVRGEAFDIPTIYGHPFPFEIGTCAGYQSMEDAIFSLFFSMSAFACASESDSSDAFWRSALAQDLHVSESQIACNQAGAAFSALFLQSLMEDNATFLPKDAAKRRDYENLTRPLVRYRLLESLHAFIQDFILESVPGRDEIDPYFLSVLFAFEVPRVCLTVWRDPALLQLSYELTKAMVEGGGDEISLLFVDSKESLLSLLDLLTLDIDPETVADLSEIKRFLSTLLGNLAEGGALSEAVSKFSLRGSAIGALAAACLAEGESTSIEEDELTSNRMSSSLMQCLVELCTVVENDGLNRKIKLDSEEAEAIAQNLGKKICQMVITRFLERAKMQQYEIQAEEEVMEAPDVAMLCAVAQHEKALKVLLSLGGFHALAQIAGEGELSAIEALRMGCKDSPELLLEADTYRSVLSLFSHDSDMSSWTTDSDKRGKVECAAFELLALLCEGSSKGRSLVAAASGFQNCMDRALFLVMDSMSSRKVELDEQDGAKMLESIVDKGCDRSPDGEDGKMTECGNSQAVEAAFVFICSTLCVQSVQQLLLQDESFIESCTTLCRETHSDVQFAAIRVVSYLARFSNSDSTLSLNTAGDVLLEVVASENRFPKGRGIEKGKDLHAIAISGFEYIFEVLSTEKQELVLEGVLKRYTELLKVFSLSRLSTVQKESTNASELAYLITNILLLALGNHSLRARFDDSLLTSMANTVQWRYDSRTMISESNILCWEVATCNALHILAHCLGHGRGSNLDKVRNSLKRNVCMVARVGKAPRKAIDFMTALAMARKSDQSSARLAAGRILMHLEGN